MKIQRKSLAVGALASVALLAAGCSSPGGGPASGGDDVTLTLSYVMAETHPWHVCGAVPFQEAIEKADVGVSISLYPAATLHGDVLEALDAMAAGNLDMTFASPAQLATRLDRLAVFDAAFLFRDVDHMNAALDSEITQELWQELDDEAGLTVLESIYYGTRHVTSNEPVRTPDDLEGVKMRVIDAPLWIDNGLAMGASPTPVAFAELYLALQQGVVDAQENPLSVIDTQSFDEVQNYVNLTAHNVSFLNLTIASESWAALSPEQQDVVTAAAADIRESAGACVLDEELELLEAWSAADSGISVNDDIDFDAFRERAKSELLPKYDSVWGDIYRSLEQLP